MKFEWNTESTEHLDQHFPFASWNGETPYYDYRVDYDILADQWEQKEQERIQQEASLAEEVAANEEHDVGYYYDAQDYSTQGDYWSQQGWEDGSEYYGEDAYYDWHDEGYDEYSYHQGGEEDLQQQHQQHSQGTPGTSDVMALALSEYTAKGETELSLAEGDAIKVRWQDDSGWWEGVNMTSGGEGWFPRTFVAFEMPLETEEKGQEQEQGEQEQPLPEETMDATFSQIIAAYAAEGEGEVDLVEGRKVYVTEADEASGWSYGDVEQTDGSFLSGWFPSSYVSSSE